MNRQTYKAKLLTPLFYSSAEGQEIKASKILSSTALTHALGYKYGELEKRYVETGEEATNPDYSHLNDLDMFISDMSPVRDTVEVSEKTFRSVDHRSERNFTTNDRGVAQKVYDERKDKSYSHSIPEVLSGGAAWQTQRRYVGIKPGAEFTFTVWSKEKLPSELNFRMGIGRTGEIKAEEIPDKDSVILNLFLLKNTFKLDEEEIQEAVTKETSFERGNDPRLQHLKGISLENAEKLIKKVL
ncbi:MAG: hypothetical protein ABEJ83_05210 [Candidatus Nanohaloarchaea archaeon]